MHWVDYLEPRARAISRDAAKIRRAVYHFESELVGLPNRGIGQVLDCVPPRDVRAPALGRLATKPAMNSRHPIVSATQRGSGSATDLVARHRARRRNPGRRLSWRGARHQGTGIEHVVGADAEDRSVAQLGDADHAAAAQFL